ncbi:hypothetical protein [Nocardia cyriacigeorgica]|uniref:Uncharacterized protein n=1 Tax=Nocardia cyriacigeorgica TaxID=135487 RepID=A0A5R8NEH0_9NOCA|nr:hypothetical protein [Nocardia cyriacigeorgica]TLF74082.1 hypothetical protein FEK34_25525 [Nocardia cyriacigeorgica]
MTTTNDIAVGQVRRDDRGRYIQADTIEHGEYGAQVYVTVVAREVGGRITTPGTKSSMTAERFAKIPLVDAAPTPTGPDINEVVIDRNRQAIIIDGTEHLYHVGSSGPRIAQGPADGSALVTVQFYVRTVRGA